MRVKLRKEASTSDKQSDGFFSKEKWKISLGCEFERIHWIALNIEPQYTICSWQSLSTLFILFYTLYFFYTFLYFFLHFFFAFYTWERGQWQWPGQWLPGWSPQFGPLVHSSLTWWVCHPGEIISHNIWQVAQVGFN